MKFVTVEPTNAPFAAATPAVVPDGQAIAKLMGARSSASDEAAAIEDQHKFVLFGLALGKANRGVALIAIDGQPAKPYRVGSEVTDEWMLKSIARTHVVLASAIDAADGMQLDLPVRLPATDRVDPSLTGRGLMALPVVKPQFPSASSVYSSVASRRVASAAAAAAAAAAAQAVNSATGVTPAKMDGMEQ